MMRIVMELSQKREPRNENERGRVIKAHLPPSNLLDQFEFFSDYGLVFMLCVLIITPKSCMNFQILVRPYLKISNIMLNQTVSFLINIFMAIDFLYLRYFSL
jgi:hypothetical protein